MALTVGAYLWPGWAHAVAVAACGRGDRGELRGIGKSAPLTRVIVAVVLAVLALVAVGAVGGGDGAPRDWPSPATRLGGVLRRRICCSSRSPGTPGSPPSARRSATRADHSPRDSAGARGRAGVYAVVAVARSACWAGRLAAVRRAAGRRGDRRRAPGSPAGPGRAPRWRRRVAAGPGPRGLPHHPGDGPPPGPARRAGRCAPRYGCRTAPRWRWPPWSWWWWRRRRARRDRLLPSRCWSTTRSPTRGRGRWDGGSFRASDGSGLLTPGVPVAAVVGHHRLWCGPRRRGCLRS